MDEFVYDGRLVRKTGRTAKKQKPSQSRRRSTVIPDHYVYEIEPAEGDISWKKWVKEEELYKIMGDTEYES